MSTRIWTFLKPHISLSGFVWTALTLSCPQSSSPNARSVTRGWWEGKRDEVNLVPRAFPSKNGWGPYFEGKALGMRLGGSLSFAFLLPITPRAPLGRDSERQLGAALQLCPPLQFGPLTYQPIEYVFVSSNQSALGSCLGHLTSQVGEGCTMSFVRFVLLIRWKTCVWNSFGVFSPMGLWRILQECEVCSKLSSGNAYVHMLES